LGVLSVDDALFSEWPAGRERVLLAISRYDIDGTVASFSTLQFWGA
jgi:hypothetical protein